MTHQVGRRCNHQPGVPAHHRGHGLTSGCKGDDAQLAHITARQLRRNRSSDVIGVAQTGGDGDGQRLGFVLEHIEQFFAGLDRRIRFHCKADVFVVEHGDGRVILVAQCALAHNLIGERGGGGDKQIVSIAGMLVEINHAQRHAAAGLVDHGDGCFHQAFVLHDFLQNARGAVDAATGRDADYDFNGFRGLPNLCVCGEAATQRED